MASIMEIANSDYVKSEYFDNGNYLLLRGHKVYELKWSNAQGKMIPTLAYTSDHYVPLVNRGHIMVCDGQFVNKLIKFELFN